MATRIDDLCLNHVPVLTGGIGRDEVRRFYQQVFIGHWPADTTMHQRGACRAGAGDCIAYAGGIPRI